MEKRGFTKINHAGIWYWTKLAFDDKGKPFPMLIKCKHNK